MLDLQIPGPSGVEVTAERARRRPVGAGADPLRLGRAGRRARRGEGGSDGLPGEVGLARGAAGRRTPRSPPGTPSSPPASRGWCSGSSAGSPTAPADRRTGDADARAHRPRDRGAEDGGQGLVVQADRRAPGALAPHGAEPRPEHAAQAADAQPGRARPAGPSSRASTTTDETGMAGGDAGPGGAGGDRDATRAAGRPGRRALRAPARPSSPPPATPWSSSTAAPTWPATGQGAAQADRRGLGRRTCWCAARPSRSSRCSPSGSRCARPRRRVGRGRAARPDPAAPPAHRGGHHDGPGAGPRARAEGDRGRRRPGRGDADRGDARRGVRPGGAQRPAGHPAGRHRRGRGRPGARPWPLPEALGLRAAPRTASGGDAETPARAELHVVPDPEADGQGAGRRAARTLDGRRGGAGRRPGRRCEEAGEQVAGARGARAAGAGGDRRAAPPPRRARDEPARRSTRSSRRPRRAATRPRPPSRTPRPSATVPPRP